MAFCDCVEKQVLQTGENGVISSSALDNGDRETLAHTEDTGNEKVLDKVNTKYSFAFSCFHCKNQSKTHEINYKAKMQEKQKHWRWKCMFSVC